METTKPKQDGYQMVTDRIIAELEKGIIPWKQTWSMAEIPRNLITMRPYRGINLWLLLNLKYERNYFLSFNQAITLGGSIKKGEKACPVVFWKRMERENEETKEKKSSFLLRYYWVFNIAQCEGIPDEKIPVNAYYRENDPIAVCDEILQNMPNRPRLQHLGHQAYYSPLGDFVNMPERSIFINSESYYGTLFHELIHSTGHSTRLSRKEVTESANFGSDKYSLEELVAEMGACYLNSVAGITTSNQFENNVAYLQSWLKVLKGDKRFIIHASAKAQQAADYILNQKDEALDIPAAQKEIVYDAAHD